jgi:hypothetical protein
VAVERPALLDAVLAKTPAVMANGGALLLLDLLAAQLAFTGTGALTLGLLHAARASFTLGPCATSLGGAWLVERLAVDAPAAWLGLAAGVTAWTGVQWRLRRLSAAAPWELSLLPPSERR